MDTKGLFVLDRNWGKTACGPWMLESEFVRAEGLEADTNRL